jgi:hypothetical protein
MCYSFFSFSQSVTPNSRKTITAEFTFSELEFSDITVTTNVLKVRNNNGKNYTFTLSLNLPSGWRTLNNEDKEYLLRPNDSVYIPVRIIASNKKAKGGTKYSVSAYINTNEGKQMAYARFLVGRPKITNWQMQILPRPRIYFLNGENDASFQINVSNQGDENQEVLVSMQKIGEGLNILDTANKIIKKNYFELNLPPYSDTTLSYNVLVAEQFRNQSRIDPWSYRPNLVALEKRYSLFIRGSEVRLETGGAIKKTKKVDFVRLANSIDFVKLNNSTIAGNGSNTIPLSIFTTINNLFGDQPLLNTIFQGSSVIGKYSSINYQFQTGLVYYKFTNGFYTSRLAGNINYNFKKGFIGYVLSGNFKTLMLGYKIKSNSMLSVFWGRERFFGSSNLNSVGLSYGGSLNRFFTFNLGARFNLFNSTNRIGQWHFANLNFNLPRIANLSLFANYINNPILGTLQDNFVSYQLGFTLNKSYKKINTSVGYFTNLSTQNTLSSTSNLNRTHNVFLMSGFNLWRGRSLNINSTYNIVNSTSIFPNDSTASFTFNNLFLISNSKVKNKKIVVIPSYYVDIAGVNINRLISYGGQFNLVNKTFKKDYFVGGTVRAGYTNLLNDKSLGAVFNTQANIFIRYKVWNLLGLYNYGPFSNIEKINVLKKSPNTVSQMIRISLGHQYQFKNKHFLWENNQNYIYLNTFKRHTFGIFSQLFYFTDNNLRFAFFVNYNITSGYGFTYSNVITTNSPSIPLETQKRNYSQGTMIGINIKKDFAIPIPKRFRNNKFCDSKFVVFLDVNGNNKMEEGEVPVENVVLRMNDYEVITNDKGAASFINISFAKYKLQVFPLLDVGSWFPNVPDSMEVCGPEPIYIPFTKGVQVYGIVELDREEFAGQLFEKLDVSRFKIYLVDSTGRTHTSVTDNRGNFNFFVPYAKYTLKFDENALGNGFYLPENDISLDLSTGIESYYHHFLIIEKKRKVKKKIFGPDGKITYVEEDASSKGKKDKKNGEDDVNNLSKADSLNNANANNAGKDGKDGSINYQIKETKLDSLIKLLNELLKKVATKPDVRAIVKQEIQLLRDEINATFTIQIEEFPKGKRPTGVLLQLIRMKKVEELKLPNGKVVYYSGDYKTVQEAEKFCKDFQSSGFKKAQVANRKTLLNSNK